MLLKTWCRIAALCSQHWGKLIQNTRKDGLSPSSIWFYSFLIVFFFLIKAITIALVTLCHLWIFGKSRVSQGERWILLTLYARSPWSRQCAQPEWEMVWILPKGWRGLWRAASPGVIPGFLSPILLQRTLWAVSVLQGSPSHLCFQKIKRSPWPCMGGDLPTPH